MVGEVMKTPLVPSPVDELPEDVRAACMTLIAYMANTGKIAFHVDLRGLKAGEVKLGDYEVNVIRSGV